MKADVSNYDANIAKARKQLDGFKQDNLSLGGVMRQASSSMLGMVSAYASVGAAIGAVSGAIQSNIETARGFEKSMSQLSSLTGMVGNDLEKLKNYAIELGSSTTLSASQVADAFKMIGSQQPQLLASGEALKAVTKEAITLAEAAGIDLATAAQTLSTSINQMGGDSNNATRYVNVLAAASQKGAGDIAWLGEAITKSATAAKAVGTDYEELVANLEQLAKAGFDASTAGTALRSIIMNLEKQANNNFKPSIVGLTQAFENLGKANLDIVGYQDIAGKMFASQAKALADAASEAKNMTEAITGTNTAEEQAATNVANLDGALKSLASAWEGLNLHINGSNGLITEFIKKLTAAIKRIDAYVVIAQAAWKVVTGENNKAGGGAGVGTSVVGVTGPNELPEVVVTGNKPVGSSGKDKNKNKTKTSGKTEEVYVEGSIAYQEQLVSKLTKKWKEAGEAIRDDYKKQLEEAQYTLDKMTGKEKFDPNKVLPMADLAGDLSKRKADVSGGVTTDLKKTLDAKTINIGTITPLKALEDELARLKALQQEFGGASAETWQAYQAEINKTQDSINKLTGDAKVVKASFKDAASAVGNLGSALSGLDDPGAKIAGTVAQAIANIALAFSSSDLKEGEKGGVWYWIAATAAGLATMVSTISSIHAATNYAEGGMIKGNSYSGDNILGVNNSTGELVGLNAGEIVLNRAAQGNLAASLQGSGGGFNGQIVGMIEGEKIVLVANRWLKRSGQGEILTWKN